MFNLEQITQYFEMYLFHFFSFLRDDCIGWYFRGLVGFRRPGLCQGPDIDNCLTLGKAFDPGQVEFPHL